jgi:hypothetical protein
MSHLCIYGTEPIVQKISWMNIEQQQRTPHTQKKKKIKIFLFTKSSFDIYTITGNNIKKGFALIYVHNLSEDSTKI